jgi:glycosyltransferase involved in cell wall biosynthesis
MSSPVKVTVLMSTYNGECYLPATIESILSQSLTDFEFVIVDDASTDGTVAIIQRYQQQDPRIQLYCNDTNQGIPLSLNRGMALAQGEYIAVIDQDDLALPSRLKRMSEYLDEHPETGLMGSHFLVINDEDDILYIQHVDTEPDFHFWKLMFGNTVAHPTCMYRTQLAKQLGGYREKDGCTADYGLVSRMAQRAKLTNYPEVLTCKRKHAAQTSTLRSSEINTITGYEIARENITRTIGETLPDDIIHGFAAWSFDEATPLAEEASLATIEAYKKAYRCFMASHQVSKNAHQMIRRHLGELILKRTRHFSLALKARTVLFNVRQIPVSAFFSLLPNGTMKP